MSAPHRFPLDPYGRPEAVLSRLQVQPHEDMVIGILDLGDPRLPLLWTMEPAPGSHRTIPEGRWGMVLELRASNGQPWMRIYWGDPDGLDDHGFHVGNTLDDTAGCVLVGLDWDPDLRQLTDSRAAMDVLLDWCSGGSMYQPHIGAAALVTITQQTGEICDVPTRIRQRFGCPWT